MSLILPEDYRFHIENQMGAQIDFSTDGANNSFDIQAIGWKFDSNGALVYGSEFEVFADPSADLSDAASVEGGSENNTTNLFLGIHCIATFVTDVAVSGQLDIYFEHSTDGGTVYPSDAADLVLSEDLIFIRSIIHPGGSAGSPDTKRVNFSI